MALKPLTYNTIVALYDGKWIVPGIPVHSDTVYEPFTSGDSPVSFFIDALRCGGFGRFISGSGGKAPNVEVLPCIVDNVFTVVMRVSVRHVQSGSDLKWNYRSKTLTKDFQPI